MVELADTIARSRAALRRTATWARLSAGTLVVLGAISFALSVGNPLSAGFLISVAVVINGIVEWRLAGRLLAQDPQAPNRLALNQVFLGGEIAAYAVAQYLTLSPDAVRNLLARPSMKEVVALVPPDLLETMMEVLPGAIRMLYVLVGGVALLGCLGTALYYRSRRRHLAVLKTATQPPPIP